MSDSRCDLLGGVPTLPALLAKASPCLSPCVASDIKLPISSASDITLHPSYAPDVTSPPSLTPIVALPPDSTLDITVPACLTSNVTLPSCSAMDVAPPNSNNNNGYYYYYYYKIFQTFNMQLKVLQSTHTQWLALNLLVHQGSFCVAFVCSPHACMGLGAVVSSCSPKTCIGNLPMVYPTSSCQKSGGIG